MKSLFVVDMKCGSCKTVKRLWDVYSQGCHWELLVVAGCFFFVSPNLRMFPQPHQSTASWKVKVCWYGILKNMSDTACGSWI